jgi:hypothetical protein
MKTWVRKTLSVGVLAAGALLFAPGAAHADTHQNSYDNNGILNGTQFFVPVSMPVNIVGNSDALLGHANAAGVGTNWWTEGGRVSQDTSHNNGIANGTQVYFPINVPVNVVGNSDPASTVARPRVRTRRTGTGRTRIRRTTTGS